MLERTKRMGSSQKHCYCPLEENSLNQIGLLSSALLWSYISVQIEFLNSECKHAIQNAECQSVNPEVSIYEVRVQSRMQNPLLEFIIAVDKASQSCYPSIH